MYAINIAMLLAVLLLGIDVNGARRWFSLGSFGTLQPSEFAKMIMLIIFAKFINDNKDRISRFSTIMITGILYLVPLVLIFEEPDLSTTLVFVFLFCVLMFVGGNQFQDRRGHPCHSHSPGSAVFMVCDPALPDLSG